MVDLDPKKCIDGLGIELRNTQCVRRTTNEQPLDTIVRECLIYTDYLGAGDDRLAGAKSNSSLVTGGSTGCGERSTAATLGAQRATTS